MRYLVRGLLVIAGLISVPAIPLAAFHWYEAAESDRFYAAHPILGTMAATARVGSALNSREPQLRTILLEYVPIGSSSGRAIATLTSEGLACGRVVRGGFACEALKRPIHLPRWFIELAVDEHDRVSDGRVLLLKG